MGIEHEKNKRFAIALENGGSITFAWPNHIVTFDPPLVHCGLPELESLEAACHLTSWDTRWNKVISFQLSYFAAEASYIMVDVRKVDKRTNNGESK